MKKGLALTFLIAILVFGVFLRLNHLNDESLWLDEGITYYNSTADSYEGVLDKVANLDQSPPAYYLIMHSYLNIFGENEFGFRFIPMIFGVLSILFLYLLMAEMFDRETALMSAFLLAVNPFHIGFSTESRMYVLLSLLALMSFYFLYKALKSSGSAIKYWLFFIFSSVFGLYTHNFFFFVLLAMAFIFLLLIWGSPKRVINLFLGIVSAALVSVFYLPWLPNFLKQLEVERYWMAANSISDIKDYFLAFSNNNIYVLYGFLILLVIGVARSFLRFRLFAPISLLLFLIIGMGAPLLYSLLFEPIMKVRYMVYLLPFWLGLVAVGLESVRKASIVLQTAIVAVVIYVWMPWHASAYPLEYGEDYRALTKIVLENPAPVVVHTPSLSHVINFYNKGRFDVFPFPFSDDLTEFNIDQNDKSKFRDLVSDFDSFYLVVAHSHENPPGLLYVWSDEYCDSALEIDVDGMNVYSFAQCGRSAM